MATVISALIPIFVVVFATVRFRQRVSARQTAGLLTAFVGVALVAGVPHDLAAGTVGSALGGEIAMVLSAVAIALYYVLSIGLAEAYSVITVAALSSLAGAADGFSLPARRRRSRLEPVAGPRMRPA